MSNALKAKLSARSQLLRGVRDFFHAHDYVEVSTPAIVPSPGMDLHLDAFEVRTHRGKPAGWLMTSPEYHMKRLLAEGAERIYQIALAFRSGEEGAVHQPQFTMLEWYEVGLSSSDMRRQTEKLINQFLNFDAPWSELPVERAFAEVAHIKMPDPANEDAFFRAFAEELQPKLGWDTPVWLIDWPASMASLAQLNPNGTADRFELFIKGMEICNGFGELTEAGQQRKRFVRDQEQRRALGKTVYPIDEQLIAALETGLPPCSGNALGIDRLLMLLQNTNRIQDVLAFPAD